jgi:hypothetical protein
VDAWVHVNVQSGHSYDVGAHRMIGMLACCDQVRMTTTGMAAAAAVAGLAVGIGLGDILVAVKVICFLCRHFSRCAL